MIWFSGEYLISVPWSLVCLYVEIFFQGIESRSPRWNTINLRTELLYVVWLICTKASDSSLDVGWRGKWIRKCSADSLSPNLSRLGLVVRPIVWTVKSVQIRQLRLRLFRDKRIWYLCCFLRNNFSPVFWRPIEACFANSSVFSILDVPQWTGLPDSMWRVIKMYLDSLVLETTIDRF